MESGRRACVEEILAKRYRRQRSNVPDLRWKNAHLSGRLSDMYILRSIPLRIAPFREMARKARRKCGTRSVVKQNLAASPPRLAMFRYRFWKAEIK